MKKIIALIMSLVMIVSLVACNSGSGDTDSAGSSDVKVAFSGMPSRMLTFQQSDQLLMLTSRKQVSNIRISTATTIREHS